MRYGSCFLGSCALAWALWLAGCETEVIRPDDGEGGSSVEGGAPGNGPGAGPGAGPGSGGSSSEAAIKADTCNNICSTFGMCSPTENCVGDCIAEDVPNCITEWAAYLNCLADGFNGNCEQLAACDAEKNVWFACQDAMGCESWGCGQDATSCTCTGECKNTSLEQVCQFTDGGMNIPCDCYADGAFLGSCTVNGDACNIPDGCCFDLL